MAWSTGIGAGVAAGGLDLAGGIASGFMAKSIAREQMNFQRIMKQHEYRTAVADMSLAGLNPMLATRFGGGGSPAGAGATVPDFGGIGTRAVTSGLSARRLKEDIDNAVMNRRHTRAKIGNENMLAHAQARDFEASASLKHQETRNKETHQRLMEAQIVGEELMADLYESMGGEAYRALQGLGGALGLLGSGFGVFMNRRGQRKALKSREKMDKLKIEAGDDVRRRLNRSLMKQKGR